VAAGDQGPEPRGHGSALPQVRAALDHHLVLISIYAFDNTPSVLKYLSLDLRAGCHGTV
jgi:hypothetical protein